MDNPFLTPKQFEENKDINEKNRVDFLRQTKEYKKTLKELTNKIVFAMNNGQTFYMAGYRCTFSSVELDVIKNEIFPMLKEKGWNVKLSETVEDVEDLLDSETSFGSFSWSKPRPIPGDGR